MTRFKTLVLTGILSTFVATTAIAAPQQDHEGKQKHQQTTSQHQQVDRRQSNQNVQQPQQAKKQPAQQQTKHTQAQQGKNTKASNNWKVGGKVPTKYHSNNYKVGHSTHNLPQPGKNQRWIKVNGDYILENVLTHVIIKVITG